MKKEDIILKAGDKVYYTNDFGVEDYVYVDFYNGYTIEEFEREFGRKITKIERNEKYETIYEAPKEILDEEEKEYLEAVLKPFRNRVVLIKKTPLGFKEYLYIALKDEGWNLPNFDKNAKYKGMQLDKCYTLEELGLFEGE